ncbi:ATP-sensitive inward rectifier potassium channel 11-like [Dendronephthya gigantea]|uniref:ATP-sensitive inward rectifier potassium channel 11-like n=1 Tax=Dendronephthya gigantea TaxID=151771 RepID=UPI00106CCBFF|nr:ATP-sensitive inward rectifier potassium channel 11-like [Dendronephthya gigantea]
MIEMSATPSNGNQKEKHLEIAEDNGKVMVGTLESQGDSLGSGMPAERSRSMISVTLHNIKEHVMNTKPKKKRLLGKRGALKVKAFNTDKGGLYFSDLFTTLVDADWRWIIAVFASSFVGSWFIFGLLWFAVAKSRDPFQCLDNVDSFPSALLLSIETQTTIGYGGRAVTPSCPDAIIILIAQSLIGLLMSAFLLGLVFTKLARPSRRADTLLFSKNSVVAPRDGKLCLLFRVGDIRESRILAADIRVQLFRTRRTAEGQDIPFYQQDLKCGIDWSDKGSGNNSLFLILPLTIVHVIDEDSPFYEMGPEDFDASADFEVVAILSGTIESTSMLVEARTSYLGDEIFWGRDFAEVLSDKCWDPQQGKYLVNFGLFNATVPVQLPLVCAKEFYRKNHEDDEVKNIIRNARTASRRILSRGSSQEGLVKRYTELWKRKYTVIQEDNLAPSRQHDHQL